jgi:hypothetical protein
MLKALSDRFNFSENFQLNNCQHISYCCVNFVDSTVTMNVCQLKTAKRANKLMFLWVKHADFMKSIANKTLHLIAQVVFGYRIIGDILRMNEFFYFGTHNRAKLFQCIVKSTIVFLKINIIVCWQKLRKFVLIDERERMRERERAFSLSEMTL